MIKALILGSIQEKELRPITKQLAFILQIRVGGLNIHIRIYLKICRSMQN